MIHLTDRSRIQAGLEHCQMARYLQYHADPYSGGIIPNSQSIPLATGTAVHAALEAILNGAAPDIAIQTTIDTYRARCSSRGFQPTATEGQFDPTDWTISEQSRLIEGLVWCWLRSIYPILTSEFEVLHVEHETHLDLSNFRVMSRPDIVCKRKSDGKLGIHDFKTTAVINVDDFTVSVQMVIAAKALEQTLGTPIDHYYIHALAKGTRRQEYDPDLKDYVGPRRQYSPLCYAYLLPGAPPMREPSWRPSYNFVGPDGNKHRLPKGYVRTPLWQGGPSSEDWIQQLPIDVIHQQTALLGPYPIHHYLKEEVLTGIEGEETRWMHSLWELSASTDSWSSSNFQHLLSRLFPRSWNCERFGSPCGYRTICFRNPGWKDPIGSNLYHRRRPHHEPERLQWSERLIPVPEEE